MKYLKIQFSVLMIVSGMQCLVDLHLVILFSRDL
uniref:Pullulanase 1ic isoform X2 n=1 Tax=Rhizophora mucronata TaxID=61149 RepID=A0A2P2M5T1_RHIMU